MARTVVGCGSSGLGINDTMRSCIVDHGHRRRAQVRITAHRQRTSWRGMGAQHIVFRCRYHHGSCWAPSINFHGDGRDSMRHHVRHRLAIHHYGVRPAHAGLFNHHAWAGYYTAWAGNLTAGIALTDLRCRRMRANLQRSVCCPPTGARNWERRSRRRVSAQAKWLR